MTVKISATYKGKKKVELIHNDSGSKILTDAPRDNNGEGSTFSPTDLVAAAFGSCVLTTIAIVAERGGLLVEGMHMSVQKEMQQEPRRIGSLPLTVHLPESLLPHERQKLERAALSCPVHRSLHPEIAADVTFVYDVDKVS
jgi:putative redox protein